MSFGNGNQKALSSLPSFSFTLLREVYPPSLNLSHHSRFKQATPAYGDLDLHTDLTPHQFEVF
jgi:hypothetical protein